MARIILALGRQLKDSLDLSLVATCFEGIHWQESKRDWNRRIVLNEPDKARRYYRLYRLLRDLRPDVLHSHQEAYAPIVARLAGVPFIIETIHGYAWRELGILPVRWMRKRSVHVHVPVSYGFSKSLIEARELCAKRVRAIPNGIPLPATPGRPALPPVVGTVTRLSREKGSLDLIPAFERIVRHIPETDFIIVGDGDLRTEVEGQLRRSGLDGKVLITGYMRRPDEYLDGFSVFVSPSHTEGFGLAAVEAMARGIPIVVTDLPAHRSICQDRRDGVLVPPRRPDMLADAVVELLRDQNTAARLAEAGANRARTEFSEEAMARRYLELYRSGRKLLEHGRK